MSDDFKLNFTHRAVVYGGQITYVELLRTKRTPFGKKYLVAYTVDTPEIPPSGVVILGEKFPLQGSPAQTIYQTEWVKTLYPKEQK